MLLCLEILVRAYYLFGGNGIGKAPSTVIRHRPEKSVRDDPRRTDADSEAFSVEDNHEAVQVLRPPLNGQ